MNQFRDILMVAMFALAVGLGIGHPEHWDWAAAGGANVVNAVNFLAEARPWSIIILCALSLALFMTRLKY